MGATSDRLSLGSATPVSFPDMPRASGAPRSDAILASSPQRSALQQLTAPCPSCSLMVGDPVGGRGREPARPGGNTTVLTPMEFGFGRNGWSLLKEIALA